MNIKNGQPASRIEGNGKRSLRRPKLWTKGSSAPGRGGGGRIRKRRIRRRYVCQLRPLQFSYQNKA